jgi:hypothetical protein
VWTACGEQSASRHNFGQSTQAEKSYAGVGHPILLQREDLWT